MSDYRIRGRVERIGPEEFFVIASGVPETSAERAIVLTITASSSEQAHVERGRLMATTGEKLREMGHRIIEVEA